MNTISQTGCVEKDEPTEKSLISKTQSNLKKIVGQSLSRID